MLKLTFFLFSTVVNIHLLLKIALTVTVINSQTLDGKEVDVAILKHRNEKTD